MSNAQLERDGLAGPFMLADTSTLDQVSEIATELEYLQAQQNKLARLSGQQDLMRWTTLLNRHMAFQVVQDVLNDTSIHSVVADCFGTNLILWQTKFFPKYPGVGENYWHHDRIIENGNDPINVYDTTNHFSFVIALTDLGTEAGRLEYIRGSHKPIEGLDRDMPRIFDDMPEVAVERITPLTLKKGEFAVFHSQVLHRSLAYGHKEEDWSPNYFGKPNPELRGKADKRSGRISLAARLARKDTIIPEKSGANPAGATRAIAEPMPYYSLDNMDRSAIMTFN
ncbi:MAG: phytanoyl-CoA dioxygenase family protein [Candidatus Azotimanducaceae bacterium]|uniref:Phytanoyl-CoA dioxygenase family protein n=1 Tax=OM182 bacterium TaxID=2510334 RepID=A0A520RX96_9GAMM|nr:hypothetical protein [Gammaproteobacteria bacterium]OUV67015.1 MAG: hypothetical protein CBC93_06850 [Gammaproteobacteria bacterium TMED133]RZO74797.1 MAG: hypothetical protein EVA68_08405 [OM182 bacterium]